MPVVPTLAELYPLSLSDPAMPAVSEPHSISTSDAELGAHVRRALESQYEIDREIGRGGMGIVYKGRDKRLKRPVAIKLLPPELAFRTEIRRRFLREAEMAAQLSHPHIVPIYSVDEREGLVYFVMALVEGENLGTRIARDRTIAPDETRRILREVGDALAYAHAQNTVHRDVKPDNILIEASSGRTMMTDFGIARALTEAGDQKLTGTGIAIGTPAFMSPEQSASDRDIDGRTDLYSLGVVAYQMLCGDLPFNATSAPALFVKHLSERPVPIDQRATVPADLARTVMLCLEKNPDDRFPDARSFVRALETGIVPDLPPRARAAYPQPATGWESASMHETGTPPGDVERWNAPAVVEFRKKLAPFLSVTGSLVVVNLVGGPDLLAISAFWGISIAYKYARLWSDGFDWRDVFKQPRDRMIVDLAAETLDDAKAIFDPVKRAEVRERTRRRLSQGTSSATGLPVTGLPVMGPSAVEAAEVAALGNGSEAAAARQALLDRDEIIRLMNDVPRADIARLPDVVPSARSLAEKVLGLAGALGALEREVGPSSAKAIEQEIILLESQANPLDREASESRVHRLATLKRNRRSVAESQKRRGEMRARLESCLLALQNMKFDVLRLKTGTQSWQHVTSIAEQAMALAREVDSVVYVGEAMARLQRPAPRG